MSATEAARLDLLDVAWALGEIAKAAPDLAPVHSCDGTEITLEVPDKHAAAPIARLLNDIRPVRSTPIHGGGWGGTIAGCPVRVLITRTRRGSVWAA